MNSEIRQGDCLDVLADVPEGSVRLVYLDPPFFTQKRHRLRTRDRKKEFLFADVWASHDEYSGFLYERLVRCRRTLAGDGSLFFHCDRRASHVARALLDRVFGAGNFRSEVVWRYRRWSNSQRTLLPNHQILYFYSNTGEYLFNPIRSGYSPSTNVDQILQRRKRDEHGKSAYDRDDSGRVVSSGAKKGVPLGDVWDVPYLNPKARERVGYPTQKPVLLLERIIRLVTNPGDLVLDPFCGSGTTLVAAALNGRRGFGIDVSEDAVVLTRERLADPVRTRSRLLECGRESYDTADRTALAYLTGSDCVPVHRNKGIDAILVEQFRGRPIPVRVQRSHESVREAATLLERAARGKHAELMILVVTETRPAEDRAPTLPPKMVVVESASVQIARALGKPGAARGTTGAVRGQRVTAPWNGGRGTLS